MLLGSSAAFAQGWIEYRDLERGFGVNFPGEPTVEDTTWESQFGATLPAVGVMDMLRYHKFTIGWAWASDYGSSDDPEGFDYLYAYSPYHNLAPGTCYPPTLVTTADHDDRVVPGHSFKFAARLQESQSCANPVLIRVETKAGHGAGKPTSKRIAEAADRWAFLVKTLGMVR